MLSNRVRWVWILICLHGTYTTVWLQYFAMARTQGTAKFDVRQKLNLGMHGISGVTLYQGAPGSKFSKAPLSRSAKGTS
jgi:hypothetical protein